MYYKLGVTWPDSFPWLYDDYESVALKLSIINGMSIRKIYEALSDCGEFAVNHHIMCRLIIEEIYGENLRGKELARTHFLEDLTGIHKRDQKYCSQCSLIGYSSVLFRLPDIKICPWHGIPLQKICKYCYRNKNLKQDEHIAPCPACGFIRPNISQIIESCDKKNYLLYEAKSALFASFAKKVGDLPLPYIFNSINFPGSFSSGKHAGIRISEFRVWGRRLGRSNGWTGIDYRKQKLIISQIYRSVCRFWRDRVLKCHNDCILVGRPTMEVWRDGCLLAFVLFLFRWKFEGWAGATGQEEKISNSALGKLYFLSPREADIRRYLSAFIFKILATVIFRFSLEREFVINIDNTGGFYNGLSFDSEWNGGIISWSNCSEEISIELDLPKRLVDFRKLRVHTYARLPWRFKLISEQQVCVQILYGAELKAASYSYPLVI